VTLRSAPSGAAELCGLDLPEDPAQDAHDRIVALAHAVLLRLGPGIHGVSVGEAESSDGRDWTTQLGGRSGGMMVR
jgi:hypothetical protein